MAWQFMRFCIVGITNTIVGFSIYYLLLFAKMHYLVAGIISGIAGIVNSFFLNTKYTFANEIERRFSWRAFVRTAMSYWSTSILSLCLLYLLVDCLGMSPYEAPVVSLFVTTPLNYLLNKYWAFVPRSLPDSMDEATAGRKILELTEEYCRRFHNRQEPFAPGQQLPYAARVYDHEELTCLVDSALDFWLTSGRYAEQFEREFAAWLGVSHCAAVNSGSSANLRAFMALTSPLLGERRILPGDEVITVAAGFPTTVAPIVQYGAIPVFSDASLTQYNLNTGGLEKALSGKTRAVMAAHTLGNPFDLARVKAFCRAHRLWLIEDHFGHNLKVTDMQAAVGVAQLKKLPVFIQDRRSNFSMFHDALRDLENSFILPEALPGSNPSWFGFILTCRKGVERGRIVSFLEKRDIQTRMLFAGNLVMHPWVMRTHLHPIYPPHLLPRLPE